MEGRAHKAHRLPISNLISGGSVSSVYHFLTDSRTEMGLLYLHHHNPCCILDALEIASTEIQNK